MTSFYLYFFIAITIFLIAAFFFLYKHASNSMYKLGGFPFVLIGMLIGLSGGGIFFFNIDSTKGWNPYGWWFFATFIATISLGLLGGVIYGMTNKELQIKTDEALKK